MVEDVVWEKIDPRLCICGDLVRSVSSEGIEILKRSIRHSQGFSNDVQHAVKVRLPFIMEISHFLQHYQEYSADKSKEVAITVMREADSCGGYRKVVDGAHRVAACVSLMDEGFLGPDFRIPAVRISQVSGIEELALGLAANETGDMRVPMKDMERMASYIRAIEMFRDIDKSLGSQYIRMATKFVQLVQPGAKQVSGQISTYAQYFGVVDKLSSTAKLKIQEAARSQCNFERDAFSAQSLREVQISKLDPSVQGFCIERAIQEAKLTKQRVKKDALHRIRDMTCLAWSEMKKFKKFYNGIDLIERPELKDLIRKVFIFGNYDDCLRSNESNIVTPCRFLAEKFEERVPGGNSLLAQGRSSAERGGVDLQRNEPGPDPNAPVAGLSDSVEIEPPAGEKAPDERHSQPEDLPDVEGGGESIRTEANFEKEASNILQTNTAHQEETDEESVAGNDLTGASGEESEGAAADEGCTGQNSLSSSGRQSEKFNGLLNKYVDNLPCEVKVHAMSWQEYARDGEFCNEVQGRASLILLDPPYEGLSEESRKEWVEHAYRASDPECGTVHLFSPWHQLVIWSDLLKRNDFTVASVPYHYVRSFTPNCGLKYEPQNAVEMALIAWRKGATKKRHFDPQRATRVGWNSRDSYHLNVITQVPSISNKLRSRTGSILRPRAEKNVDLIQKVVVTHGKPGGLVYDPCAGSMSSVAACIKLGYPVVAVEVDQECFKAGFTSLHGLVSSLTPKTTGRKRVRDSSSAQMLQHDDHNTALGSSPDSASNRENSGEPLTSRNSRQESTRLECISTAAAVAEDEVSGGVVNKIALLDEAGREVAFGEEMIGESFHGKTLPEGVVRVKVVQVTEQGRAYPVPLMDLYTSIDPEDFQAVLGVFPPVDGAKFMVWKKDKMKTYLGGSGD